MKILRFACEDQLEGWKLSETQFNNSLTLLVGASGVGKSLILQSLLTMREIAKGAAYPGAKWKVDFVLEKDKCYRWEGAFRGQDRGRVRREINEENLAKIDWENLFLNDKPIIKRDQEGIFLFDKKMPKLSLSESVLSIFKEEDAIKPAHDGFRAIRFADHTNSSGKRMYYSETTGLSYVNDIQKTENISSLKDIQKVKLPPESKLFLLEKCDSREFSILQDRFVSIFPQVEAIKSAPHENLDEELPPFFRDMLVFQIKERGIDHWIEPQRISSGMMRVIKQLCDLFLNLEGTVFLIDEFENSLGINCIKEITQDIISQDRCFQFIVTSHHPYIINNISVDYWKLVTRNGGVVKTHSLGDLGRCFKESHHETFMQLIQLHEYRTGQERSK